MFGLISREHHAEVVAAKDALIRSLEVQNAVLAERLAEPVVVTVKLPEDFAMVQPAVLRRKRQQDSETPRREVREVDWANVDISNPILMADLASQEFGRMLSPIELSDWVKRVARQVVIAKQGGSGIPTMPMSETTAVPPHILEKIAAAERV